MNILEATRSYEAWMAARLPVVRKDLILKHQKIRISPFVFLRGTFYRWAQLWPSVCPNLQDAPRVLAVGDLHLENFGTWRDIEGRLIWGVNDVDEACTLPYTNDLVRLATSAVLASRTTRLALTPREACEAIVDGFAASLDRGGEPVVLAERRRWLRRLALGAARDPAVFWDRLTSLRSTTSETPDRLLRSLLPERALKYRVARRTAGVGSLGRTRVVALAMWGGGMIAREAKAWLPSATAWTAGRTTASDQGARLLARAIRVPDPTFAIKGGWIVRRLAPDCSRVELTDLPKERDEEKLLRTMGWETANVHLGTPGSPVRRDSRTRKAGWLLRAAEAMADATTVDWRDWVRSS